LGKSVYSTPPILEKYERFMVKRTNFETESKLFWVKRKWNISSIRERNWEWM